MHTSARSAFLHYSIATSLTSRTAVYGPVRTVVWQGSAGDCRPYADLTGFGLIWTSRSGTRGHFPVPHLFKVITAEAQESVMPLSEQIRSTR
jgi:hypothetical protein